MTCEQQVMRLHGPMNLSNNFDQSHGFSVAARPEGVNGAGLSKISETAHAKPSKSQ